MELVQAVKVLIIDDSKAMRIILGRIFTEIDCVVAEAVNGLTALVHLETEDKPNLILVDWNMPEMNGLAFVKTVRAEPEYDSILLMMVTTETELTNVATALAAGANEYVMKPFTTDIIINKLQLLGLEVPGIYAAD